MKLKSFILFCIAGVMLNACNNAFPPLADSNDKSNVKAAAINVQLGVGYLQEGQTERARKKLLTALKQGPHYQPAYDAMAYFLEKTGQVDEAKEFYSRSLAINSSAGSTQNNYGAFLCRQHRYNEAIDHFMTAVKDTNYLTPANAYENAGLCSESIPDKARAKKYFQQALLADPNRPVSALELAQMSFDEGNYSQASAYLQVVERNALPTPASLWLSIQVQRKLKNLDKADSDSLLLKNNYPTSPEAKLLARYHG